MVTWSDEPEPCAQPGFVLAALSFLVGALVSWWLVVRPAFRRICYPRE